MGSEVLCLLVHVDVFAGQEFLGAEESPVQKASCRRERRRRRERGFENNGFVDDLWVVLVRNNTLRVGILQYYAQSHHLS